MGQKIRICIALILFAVLIFSGYKVWEIQNVYEQNRKIREKVEIYKPTIPQTSDDSEIDEPVSIINEGLIALQKDYPDVVGWVSVSNTKVDYPFVQTKDNNYYLRKDLDGKKAQAGTVFMDYRCAPDFSDYVTTLYGHHMHDGSMFGSLISFDDEGFFNANSDGVIFLQNKNIQLEIFAFAVIKPKDWEIYSLPSNYSELCDYVEYVYSVSRYHHVVSVTETDRLVLLSTCSYEFENGRMIILAKCVD